MFASLTYAGLSVTQDSVDTYEVIVLYLSSILMYQKVSTYVIMY